MVASDRLGFCRLLPVADWAFQLAAGGVCALLLVRLPASIGSSSIAAAVGATLVGASAFFLYGGSLFPGLQVISVTAGAALLLMSGQTANPVSRIFYFAPLRAIGIISYSLYLWHWPVLAFARYFYGGELSPSLQAGAALTMFVLSVLSWKYVEVPARVTRLGFVPVAIRAFVAPVAVLSVVASVLILSRGMLFHNPSYAAAIAQASRRDAPSFRLPFVCQKPEVGISDIQNPACIIGSTEEPRFLPRATPTPPISSERSARSQERLVSTSATSHTRLARRFSTPPKNMYRRKERPNAKLRQKP